MITIQQKVRPAMSRGLPPDELNRILPALARNSLSSMNMQKSFSGERETVRKACFEDVPQQTQRRRQQTAPQQAGQVHRPRPVLQNCLARGQKTALNLQRMGCTGLRIGFGWNAKDPRCDVDVSAFLVTQSGKVPDDSWFVFYSQQKSPDGSTVFCPDGGEDRECITVDLARLFPQITRIVFVLTINEALEQKLHFGMMDSLYIRVMNDVTGEVLASYQPEEYDASITSMTLGELYLHHNEWKFNPVGNGVHEDLAGQCAVYGVQIS